MQKEPIEEKQHQEEDAVQSANSQAKSQVLDDQSSDDDTLGIID